jgi:hypothetical protein
MRGIFAVYFFSLFLTSFSQVSYDETDFQSPLGIELVLAGNFAEMRSNHFHTGLDIKTNGREGYKIYAIDSGYISRINVSHYGYGNAIYVRHPNGYTSVYAHLSTFPKFVLDYIRKKQYSNKSETIQVYPGPNELKLAKGEVFAFSGNSGSSSAPHLHFEIRETETERPVNPLLFNFDIKDDKKPSLLDVKVYALENGFVNGKKAAYNMDLKGANGVYEREYDYPVKVKGNIGLAINAIDYLNGASNKCGIYTVELFIDDKLKFKQKLEKLVFADNRYINTHSDYLEYRLNKQSYHKSFKTENNKLDIYEVIEDDGRISFDDTLVHKIKYVVKDVYGNTSIANFSLKSEGLSDEIEEPLAGQYVLDASSRNEVKTEDFEVIMKKNTVYEDLKYDYKNEVSKNSFAPIHTFHNDYIPVQQYFVLRLKTTNLPSGYENKSLIVEMSKSNKVAYAKGGEYKDGWVETEVRSFGNYTVKIDTVAPKLTPLNISEGKNLANAQSIEFKMADNLSGIKEYNAYVDDQWILSYYNTRKGTLTIPFDEYNIIKKGNHVIKIVLEDERKNVTSQSYSFIR